MNIQIKNRWNNTVIHEGEYPSMIEALTEATRAKADLRDADLYGASLSYADLSGANLSGANLSGANLHGANLYGANLSGASLSGAKNSSLAIARTRILPEGEIIGWKKLRAGVIAKLRIPERAKRCHAFERKCRASEALVEVLFSGENEVFEGFSKRDDSFRYAKGETVCPREPFCEDWQNECASGIHFFITREEAEAY